MPHNTNYDNSNTSTQGRTDTGSKGGRSNTKDDKKKKVHPQGVDRTDTENRDDPMEYEE